MSSSQGRVLIVTPSFPAVETGAEQNDRAEGIRQIVRLGFEVVVISKVTEWADKNLIQLRAKEMGVRVVTVPYRFSNRSLTLKEKLYKFLGRLKNPLYLDGAAYEYSEPQIKKALVDELERFKPSVVWFEYSYLWPLYSLVRKKGIRIITRSINFEPDHFLMEDGRALLNYIKYIPKFIGEFLVARKSDVILAITPNERRMYERLGARRVEVLPLRGLYRFAALERPIVVRETLPLHVFFMGSSYNVGHNRAAAAFLLKDIVPEVRQHARDAFIFHILGAKLPADLSVLCGNDCFYEGYVEDLDTYLLGMDIALIPSLMGAGQQQKVFEPIVRGIPTITSPRAIAGYPLEAGKHYIGATTPEDFVQGLQELQNASRRQALSRSASLTSNALFSQEALDAIVRNALVSI